MLIPANATSMVTSPASGRGSSTSRTSVRSAPCEGSVITNARTASSFNETGFRNIPQRSWGCQSGDNGYPKDSGYIGGGMRQEVVLALLAKEPSYGYQLRARLRQALGPLGGAMNAGQIYVTLGRLETAGLVTSERSTTEADRPDRKVYGLTATGQQRVAEWLAEVSWPKPDLAEFHLKLIAAATAGLADPVGIVDAQRRELLRRLHDAQRAAMAEPDGSDAALLVEGIVLRLQADLRWLEACEQNWTGRGSGS
jgi:DNA-binding PadR family transcriptional regulator